MDRLVNYLASDDKKVGFTQLKALLTAIGLGWWGKNSIQRRIYKPIPISVLMLNFFGIMHFLVRLDFSTTEGFIEMIRSIIFLQSNLFVALKLSLFQYYAATCRDAVDSTEDLQLKYNIKTNTGMQAKIIRFYAGSILFTYTGWLVYGTYRHGVPLKVSYPLGSFSNTSVYHGAVWLIQAYCGFLVSAGNGSCDSTLVLIINAMINFGQELKCILERIGYNPSKDDAILRDVVKMHVLLIQLKEKVIKGFRVVLLCQVVYTIVHTCMIVFSATKISDTAFIMTAVIPIMIAAYFQLFVFCYTGEMLSSMMDDLAFSAYNNKWYDSNMDSKKRLILIMEATKRPGELHSFGIVRASFETCLNSIRESFSYYVVLKTFASDLKED